MRTLKLVMAVLATSALAACSSSSTPKTAPGSGHFDPAAAAKALEALGTVATRGTATASGPVQPIRTTIDYGHGTMQGQFPPGVPTKPIAVQYRAKDTTAWFRRAVATASVWPGLGPDLLVLRAPGSVPWIETGRTGNYAGLIMRPWDPAWLLDDVSTLPGQLGPNVVFRPRSAAEINGTNRRAFSARLTPRQQGYLGVQTVTVWVDAHGLPVRIRVVTPTLTRGTYDIAKAAGPLTVTPPPESQIERANQPDRKSVV